MDRLYGGNHFSFRYGGTYLTPSRSSAATYASRFPYGEALTSTLKLLRLLAAVRADLAEREEFNSLTEFAALPGRPILVEAQQIELSSLRTEQGGDIHQVFARIEAMTNDSGVETGDIADIWLSQSNFELIQPVPRDQLKFHTFETIVESDGDGGSQRVLRLSPFVPTWPSQGLKRC